MVRNKEEEKWFIKNQEKAEKKLRNMMASGKMTKSMVRVLTNSFPEMFIKVYGMKIKGMGLVFIFGKTDPNIMDNGSILKWMVKELFILQTVHLFKVNSKMMIMLYQNEDMKK